MTIKTQSESLFASIPIRSASKTANAPQKLNIGEQSSQKHEAKMGVLDDDRDGATSLIHIALYIFRGAPDTYYNRHVLAYFTSPDDSNFHEIVHTQRDTERSPWVPKRESGKIDWLLVLNYLDHVNAGAIKVSKGQEMAPVSLVASANVQGRETDSGWNCQHFLLEGLQKLVDGHYQTQAWYDAVQEELTDKLLEGSVP